MSIVKFAGGAILAALLSGCVGYVEGDGSYGAAVAVPVPEPPDIFFFGGVREGGERHEWREEHEGRREVHDFSRRGAESRGSAQRGRGHDEHDRR